MLNLETFDAFVAALRSHDWHYDYSDDHAVWRRGRDAARKLQDRANSHPLLSSAHGIWHAYIYAGLKKDARDTQLDDLRNKLIATA